MKASVTSGCISTLLRSQGVTCDEHDVRVRFAPTGDSLGTPFENAPRRIVESNAPTLCASQKPIIRGSTSSYSLGRHSISVRFLEQPPVYRAGVASSAKTLDRVAPLSHSGSDDLLSCNFERSLDDPYSRVNNARESVQTARDRKDYPYTNGSAIPVQQKDRSRLRLDLPIQLSRMALSTMNGGGDNMIQQGSIGGPVCVNCGRGFEPDEPSTNVNGNLWHASCFTAASSVPLCDHCYEPVSEGPDERIVAYQGRFWHSRCFVCAQCFRSFKDGVFYEFDGRKYCEDDFNMLFAPCCKRCDAFITGRVIKAMNCNWHPACFCCEECSRCLADEGFVKNAGRALCKDCNLNVKANSKVRHVCFRCRAEVDDGALLRYKGEVYHAYHFKCHSCGVECNADAREKEGELFCLRCYDKMGVKICAACRRPIDERVVNAMGKTWHVEHFVCAKCEKPFLGSQHHEKKGQAYCTTHYLMLFGNVCFYCEQVISSEVVAALSKNWCPEHFACSVCDKKLGPKSKFYDFDLKPVCKACYDKFPTELQKRLKKMSEKK